MKKRIRRFFPFCAALCLFWNCNTLSAFAEVSLPEGTVVGLPEKLTVMDSDGTSVDSDTGEYYFSVEDMQPDVAYTKEIQLMNLREDKAYEIYFYAEPLENSGELDLEANSTAVFTLDGTEVFTGSVSGISSDGATDLSQEPILLGTYEPGESRTLTCTITWDGSDFERFIDYGQRIVSTEGVTIVSDGNGVSGYISGEVTFRWIFYAVVDETYTPPKTGIFETQTWIYLAILGALVVLIGIFLVLLLRKKKKAKH